jgi:hypothetical protein
MREARRRQTNELVAHLQISNAYTIFMAPATTDTCTTMNVIPMKKGATRQNTLGLDLAAAIVLWKQQDLTGGFRLPIPPSRER